VEKQMFSVFCDKYRAIWSWTPRRSTKCGREHFL